MKSFITWMFVRFVYMPHMRSLPNDRLRFEHTWQSGIDLIDDVQMLNEMLAWNEKPLLSVVEG
jgi:hypothetical protein